MLIDLSVPITKEDRQDALGNERMAAFGHLGTHFDAMDREFPLEFTRRKGLLFDAGHVCGRDIAVGDVDLARVEAGMFVAFRTGFIEQEQYGTKRYFSEHPQLSNELIDCLLERHISILAVDCAGVRRGKEHTPKDQYCADHGVFVVENLYALSELLKFSPGGRFTAHTYPVRFLGATGLPCRVVAETL